MKSGKIPLEYVVSTELPYMACCPWCASELSQVLSCGPREARVTSIAPSASSTLGTYSLPTVC